MRSANTTSPPPHTNSTWHLTPWWDFTHVVGITSVWLVSFDPFLTWCPDEASLTIIEQEARFLREVGRFPITLDLAQLKDCNPVFITALTLLNGSLDEVLSHCSTSARIAVIGPTASCLPEPLFARGVEVVGGARVGLLTRFRQKLLAGQPWAETVAKYCIHRDQYQGVGAGDSIDAKQ